MDPVMSDAVCMYLGVCPSPLLGMIPNPNFNPEALQLEGEAIEPATIKGFVERKCACGEIIDQFGIHGHCCGKQAEYNPAHHALCQALTRTIADTKERPLREQSFCPAHPGWSMDILVPNDNQGGEPKLIDVSVMEPGAKTYLPKYDDTLFFDKKITADKLTKYHVLKGPDGKPVDHFTVFSMTTHGRLGKQAEKLLTECSKVYAERFHTPYVSIERQAGWFKDRAYRLLSVSSWKWRSIKLRTTVRLHYDAAFWLNAGDIDHEFLMNEPDVNFY